MSNRDEIRVHTAWRDENQRSAGEPAGALGGVLDALLDALAWLQPSYAAIVVARDHRLGVRRWIAPGVSGSPVAVLERGARALGGLSTGAQRLLRPRATVGVAVVTGDDLVTIEQLLGLVDAEPDYAVDPVAARALTASVVVERSGLLLDPPVAGAPRDGAPDTSGAVVARGLVVLGQRPAESVGSDTRRRLELIARAVGRALALDEQRRSLQRRGERLHEAGRRVTADLLVPGSLESFFGTVPSRSVQRLLKRARRVARSDLPVLIRGERGTGASMLARLIHEWSPRASEPLVPLLGSRRAPDPRAHELLGSEPGRRGRIALAHLGTLYIEDIDRLGLRSQRALVDWMEADGRGRTEADDRRTAVDFRTIASSAAPLEAMTEQGHFDAELFESLSVAVLELPRLRDAPGEIPAIANAYLERLARRRDEPPRRLSESAEQLMSAYAWPGNLLELCSVLDGLAQNENDPGSNRPGDRPARLDVDPDLLRAPERDEAPHAFRVHGFPELAELERAYIEAVLRRTGGKIYGEGGAAQLLGLKPSTLQSRMAKLDVERPQKGRARHQ